MVDVWRRGQRALRKALLEKELCGLFLCVGICPQPFETLNLAMKNRCELVEEGKLNFSGLLYPTQNQQTREAHAE